MTTDIDALASFTRNPQIPGVPEKTSPLDAMIANRDLWHRVAGERLAHIGKLRDDLDAMRRERDEALGRATHAEATGGDEVVLRRLQEERDAARSQLASAIRCREKALVSLDGAHGEFRDAVAGRKEAVELCNDMMAQRDAAIASCRKLEAELAEAVSLRGDAGSEVYRAAIAGWDKAKSDLALAADRRSAVREGPGFTAAEPGDLRGYHDACEPGVESPGGPDVRTIPGLVDLGDRADRIDRRLAAAFEAIRGLSRCGEECSRRVAMLEALTRNLTQQVESVTAKFDHPKLIALLRPENGEPAHWTANIRTKAGATAGGAHT